MRDSVTNGLANNCFFFLQNCGNTTINILVSSVMDLDARSGAFLTLDPGSGFGMWENSGSGMNISDHIPRAKKQFLG
jgi:hypothetical protein